MRRICAVLTVVLGAIGFATPGQAALTVSTHATQNVSCVSGYCTATAAHAFMKFSDLQTMLSSCDVTLSSQTVAGDIVISHSLHWASAYSFTLDAHHSIQINALVADQGSGGVMLTTNDGGTGGTLSFGSAGSLSFLGTTNPLTINGQSYTLVGDIATLASGIAATPTGNFALAHNYDAKGDGIYTSYAIPTVFTGRLEGLGNAISRFTFKRSDSGRHSFDYGAFMFEIGIGGTVENLLFKQEVINLHARTVRIAGLVIDNAGSIRGVSAGVTATGSYRPGRGFDCQAAGLVMVNVGTIDHASVSGSVSCADGGKLSQVGGLVAFGGNNAPITNTHSSASVYGGTGQVNAGGLIGYTYGNVSNSYATGNVGGGSMGGSHVGGLIGIAAGGDDSTIINDYATGAVTGGTNTDAGGLIGYNGYFGPPEGGLVQKSYSTGAVTTGTGGRIGGFTGYDGFTTGITLCYWDTDTSGVSDLSDGAGGYPNDPGISGLSDATLKSGLPSGFDSSMWGQNAGINTGWPYLLNNPPQ